MLPEEDIDFLKEKTHDITEKWFELVERYTSGEITFKEFEEKALYLTVEARSHCLPFVANVTDIRNLIINNKKLNKD